jgi:hypothetical protein
LINATPQHDISSYWQAAWKWRVRLCSDSERLLLLLLLLLLFQILLTQTTQDERNGHACAQWHDESVCRRRHGMQSTRASHDIQHPLTRELVQNTTTHRFGLWLGQIATAPNAVTESTVPLPHGIRIDAPFAFPHTAPTHFTLVNLHTYWFLDIGIERGQCRQQQLHVKVGPTSVGQSLVNQQ